MIHFYVSLSAVYLPKVLEDHIRNAAQPHREAVYTGVWSCHYQGILGDAFEKILL